ncbi:YciI family protein [Streptomyces sp. NPDC051940]|uniref:YciI family protein n=1 Tax=Streptomyces sp. NPDC051940 TaxID=3155675 RepID=UPI00343656F1
MPYYVHAQDKPGVGERLMELAEEHWSYMDRFADGLILRGPTLSEDGEEHTGSVHVVDLDDRAAAERFAAEEPYWSAGLYEDVTADRTVVLLDRPSASDPLAAGLPLALVIARWPAKDRGADDLEPQSSDITMDGRMRFVAVLVDDDEARTTGVVAVVTTVPEDAHRVVRPLADRLAGEPTTLTAQRWTRGGRN